jgi:hypothetical protein
MPPHKYQSAPVQAKAILGAILSKIFSFNPVSDHRFAKYLTPALLTEGAASKLYSRDDMKKWQSRPNWSRKPRESISINSLSNKIKTYD